jgi:transcription elongation factor Elf1
MTWKIVFECPDCGEQFVLSAETCADPERMLFCPCCGSCDLERGPDLFDDVEGDLDTAAA